LKKLEGVTMNKGSFAVWTQSPFCCLTADFKAVCGQTALPNFRLFLGVGSDVTRVTIFPTLVGFSYFLNMFSYFLNSKSRIFLPLFRIYQNKISLFFHSYVNLPVKLKIWLISKRNFATC
jgi:hypothetical protein